jgi:hypothetical protein
MISNRAFALASSTLLALTACASPAPPRYSAYPYPYPYPPPAAALASAPPPCAPAAPAPAPATAPPRERLNVAVLPVHEDTLFRAERAALRVRLASELAARAKGHTFVPLADVDAKLRPISSTSGARCAFEDAPLERRAKNAGFAYTNLIHVAGVHGSDDELWVEIIGWNGPEMTFTSAWDPKLTMFARYERAITALQLNADGGGLLGGLAARGSRANAGVKGPVTICEEVSFGACTKESARWVDRADDVAACYAGEDAVENEVLLEGGALKPRCELTNVDDLEGKDGKREACLCKALASSAALRDKTRRTAVRVIYEAPDLAGKPRPEVRVVDATTNVPVEDDWHSVERRAEGKVVYAPVYRLAVDNLDGFAAPLARCAAPAGAVLVAELDVQETGAVGLARVVAGAAKRELSACVEKALGRGALTCTSDGKAATVRLAVTWPAAAPPPPPTRR